ncbi:MAG: DUF1385 domain-containing protein [Clostridia bacterium]|nr:DUF1385 domain-containing protein [Clostridia bacterium]
MKRCAVGGQAVMEGVMMKNPQNGTALAVRQSDGTIVTEYYQNKHQHKKGTFPTWPVVRGVYAFVEALVGGMKITTRSAELLGEDMTEEPTKFEKWLSKKLGKSAGDMAMTVAVILAAALAVGLFVVLPSLVVSFFGIESGFVVSLLEGVTRLLIFLGYMLAISRIKDIRRVFMYHGAEHKTIACYEAEDELTPENAMKHTRLHPRCGTNYLFLVMAVSIVFFAVVGWNDSLLVRVATRLIFLPVVAGLSYELLKFAARHENLLTRIIRAPGMGLQYIITKEPTPDMIEVAMESFHLAMMSEEEAMAKVAERNAQLAAEDAKADKDDDDDRREDEE